MTRPKKWYLDETLGDGTRKTTPGIIIKIAEGPMRKPNASQPLGTINSVSEAEEQGKTDSILVGIYVLYVMGERNIFLSGGRTGKHEIQYVFFLCSSVVKMAELYYL